MVSYQKSAGLKVRETSDGRCMLSLSGSQGVFVLNPSAWFVFELCESRSLREIVHEYEGSCGLQGQEPTVLACLEELERIGAISVNERGRP